MKKLKIKKSNNLIIK